MCDLTHPLPTLPLEGEGVHLCNEIILGYFL